MSLEKKIPQLPKRKAKPHTQISLLQNENPVQIPHSHAGREGEMLMARIDRRITAVDMDRFKGDVRLKLPLCKKMDNLTEVATLENDQ